MIWVILTVVSVAIWGLADMLSKKGTEPEDPFSHILFVICTGVAMLVFTPFFRAFSESGASLPQLLAQYPVFLLITLAYVVSLLLSFFSFRHLEASVASPLCNTSAAMILLMLLAFYLFSGRRRDVLELLTPLNVLASLLVCGGVIASAWCALPRMKSSARDSISSSPSSSPALPCSGLRKVWQPDYRKGTGAAAFVSYRSGQDRTASSGGAPFFVSFERMDR